MQYYISYPVHIVCDERKFQNINQIWQYICIRLAQDVLDGTSKGNLAQDHIECQKQLGRPMPRSVQSVAVDDDDVYKTKIMRDYKSSLTYILLSTNQNVYCYPQVGKNLLGSSGTQIFEDG